jgi:ATP-dependent 26S proteasome regulatory subunit
MTATIQKETWHEANQRYLIVALDQLRERLEQHGAGERAPSEPGNDLRAEDTLHEIAASMETPPALEWVADAFRLSPFERDLLLLCAGIELDSKMAHACAQLIGDPRRPCPTFSLALSVLPDPHWSALIPTGPLRYWRLIEIGAGPSLTTSPLRVDETILHYLAGVHHLDERLVGIAEAVVSGEALLPSQERVVAHLADLWQRHKSWVGWPVLHLTSPLESASRLVAATLCQRIGMHLYAMKVKDIPPSTSERESLKRLWERQILLSPNALLFETSGTESPEFTCHAQWFAEGFRGPTILCGQGVLLLSRRRVCRLDIAPPTADEQQGLWRDALGPLAHQLNGEVDAVMAQFHLEPQAIQAVGQRLTEKYAMGQERIETVLWETCREQARTKLEGLAQHLESRVTWEDLVLPELQRQTLREIAANVRQRATVYEAWGFAEKGTRGLGIAALFSGASGTGKTLAAEVLANELRMDLHKIDLSQVISKYIGETEKNLHRVFEAAEASGAILLFDEADAIFGRRSEVKDSHDRYANIEVSYLLQRMEAYRGLAILTTNMKDALDPAFLRRIRFVVEFPFPDSQQRAEIWRRVFPKRTPTEGLDYSKLARLNVTGGNIRNVALNAAFLAADANEPVRMKHVAVAARSEHAKLGKPFPQADTAGWV